MAFGTKRFAGFYFGEGDASRTRVVRGVGGTPDRRPWSERDRLDRRLEIAVRQSQGRRRQLDQEEELAALLALGMV